MKMIKIYPSTSGLTTIEILNYYLLYSKLIVVYDITYHTMIPQITYILALFTTTDY